MDSHQIFGYRVAGTDSSYSSSHPTVPTKLFGALRFETRNSPTSPFSTHFDSETTFTSLNDSQEQVCSSENPQESSPSSLEGSSSFHQFSPSPFLQNASSAQSTQYTLQDIETALMSPDEEEEEEEEEEGNFTRTPSLGENKWPQAPVQRSRSWSQEVVRPQVLHPQHSQAAMYDRKEDRHEPMEETSFQGIPPGNLKQLLIACARALAEHKLDDFEKLVEYAHGFVSISGEPIQRLGAYMIEGLVARKEASGTNIYRALKCKEPPQGKDLLSYMQILYEICPYLKFGYMAANGAIAEACKNEDRIHIIDFQIAQGTQWMTLLQALAARPKGPPHVRITGIDDPASKYARGDSLELVGKRLAAISEKFNIPVEFHPLPVYAPYVTKELLDVRPGEALAVNFPLQLHHTPDESVDVNNPRDERLRMIKSLSPKVVTLIEQESNTNTAPFFPRFLEALDYYSAIFESIDVTMPRDKKERIKVEQHCLAREIVNVIACEGKEREERHELFGKWRSRLTMAGFKQFPLSSYVNSVIKGLLKCYSEHYTLVEQDGGMLLGWKERNLVSASAWH